MGSNVGVKQPNETFAGYTSLETKVCPTCGVLYAAPARLFEVRYEHGGSWYCPNGHSLVFTRNKQDEVKRLERQLESERNYAARLNAEREQLRSDVTTHKRRASRFKNDRDRDRQRVAGGVCPCCNRTFQNLGRHMKSQHPDFAHDERS